MAKTAPTYCQMVSRRMSASKVVAVVINAIARNYQSWSCFLITIKTVVADRYQEEVHDAEKSVS